MTAILHANDPLFPRKADGEPSKGFAAEAKDEVLLLTPERINNMDVLVDNYPCWFMDPTAQGNYARTITTNPQVMRLSYTDNLDVVFQEAPLSFLNMFNGLLNAVDLWSRDVRDKNSLTPDDPDQVTEVMNDLLRRQTLGAFLHAAKIAQASLFDKMKRQLGPLWHSDLDQNTMEANLTKQYCGLKYTYSIAQQQAWSADFTTQYNRKTDQLAALLGTMDTFKRKCGELKIRRAADALSGLHAAVAGPHAAVPGGPPAAHLGGTDTNLVLARGMATEHRSPPKAASLSMSENELKFFSTKARNWFADTNAGTLSATGQHQAASELFEKAFWEKILNKNRNDCKRTSRTGEVRDQDLVLNLDKALRLATNIWDAQNAADSASVSVVKFFNNYIHPMLSGKTPLATVTQQRDTYSSLSDAYLSMTSEVFQNHNSWDA